MEIPLNSHWSYLKYVLKHKWYVFLECRKTGLPLWVGIIHDWSKFTPSEWTPYVRFFHTKWEKDEQGIPDNIAIPFKYAWLYHQRRNPHHWEYWIKSNIISNEALDMPEHYRKEMFADMKGAGYSIHGYDNLKEYYKEIKDTMILHENTREWFEKQIEENKDKGDCEWLQH